MTVIDEAWQPTFKFFSDKVAREITAEEGPGWHTEIDAQRLLEPWSPCASFDPPDYWSVIAHSVGEDGKPCVWTIAFGLDRKTARHICDLHNAAISGTPAEDFKTVTVGNARITYPVATTVTYELVKDDDA